MIGLEEADVAGEEIAAQPGFHIEDGAHQVACFAGDLIGALHPADRGHEHGDLPEKNACQQQHRQQGNPVAPAQQSIEGRLIHSVVTNDASSSWNSCVLS